MQGLELDLDIELSSSCVIHDPLINPHAEEWEQVGIGPTGFFISAHVAAVAAAGGAPPLQPVVCHDGDDVARYVAEQPLKRLAYVLADGGGGASQDGFLDQRST